MIGSLNIVSNKDRVFRSETRVRKFNFGIRKMKEMLNWLSFSLKINQTFGTLAFRFSRCLYNGSLSDANSSCAKTFPQKAFPPYNLRIHKGSFSAAMQRDFVDFLLDHRLSKALLVWLNDTYIPDEYFWSTLYHSYYRHYRNFDV
jgi:hypothetical protein